MRVFLHFYPLSVKALSLSLYVPHRVVPTSDKRTPGGIKKKKADFYSYPYVAIEGQSDLFPQSCPGGNAEVVFQAEETASSPQGHTPDKPFRMPTQRLLWFRKFSRRYMI